VLENEEIGLALAGDPDEGLVVILDGSYDFFAAGHLDAHRRCVFDELLQILSLFERLFGRAPGFATLLYRIGSPAPGVTLTRTPEPRASASL
jgi:hypothetical protein